MKVIVSVLFGLIPILILWLSGDNLSRSPALAGSASISFILAISCFVIMIIEEMQRKK